ncbi:septation protein SepH [Angustibacter luteus]|uniref:Septation protein SepH n=1 Tax=Angustibacter luteus TaxID=658456 RepID=A0ABW1J8X3_9ACTN
MHDLRLVGVHDDGEHLVLGDADGQRFLLSVDEALRAAVRRDRAHLGQLQIEMGGGLRPAEVQARVRAGATAEDVAAACGWPVDRVRRYEGPVLAEREHVAEMARAVTLRGRGKDQVTLGTEVGRRLAGRGVDPDTVSWDSWRTDDGPWTVVLTFPAGGRTRQARWHFDATARTVTPADDEARWLSEQAPEADGPLGGARLAAVPNGSLYDIEADGGVDGPPVRERSDVDDPLDLMTAMRSRRRERDLHRTTTRRPHSEPVDPADVPGARHPARRRRAPVEAPLELDPALLGDPPAAHPPASEVAALVAEATKAAESTEPVAEPHRWPLAAQMHEAARADDEDTGEIPVPEPVEIAQLAPEPEVDTTSEPTSDTTSDTALDATSDEPDEPDDEHGGPGKHRPAARARRSSVPSWDDIMFGAKRD